MGQLVDFINIGIVLYHGVKPVRSESVLPHPALLFKATDYRGEYDITTGREAYYEEFLSGFFLFDRLVPFRNDLL
jgi:hypothetical protein